MTSPGQTAQNAPPDDTLQKLVAASRALAQQVLALTDSLSIRDENGLSGPSQDGAAIVGELVIDPKSWRVTVDGRPIHLSRLEFLLLQSLAERCGEVVTYDELLANVWRCQPQSGSRNLVANCVRRIRHKMDKNNQPRFNLQAVPGIGYRLYMDSAPGSRTDGSMLPVENVKHKM